METNVKIDFYLRYYTHPGQSIVVTGNIPALGNGDPEKALPLEYVDGEFWHGSLPAGALLPEHFPFSYHYILHREDGTQTEEWGDDKVIVRPADGVEEVQVIDAWNYAGEYENVFFTDPFREVLLPGAGKGRKGRSRKALTHVFMVKAPLLREGEVLCLSGNADVLGAWKEEDAVLLEREDDWW